MVLARGAAFEFGVPAVHGVGTDSGGFKHGNPHVLVHGGRSFAAGHAQQGSQNALLDAQGTDFVAELAQAFFEEEDGAERLGVVWRTAFVESVLVGVGEG